MSTNAGFTSVRNFLKTASCAGVRCPTCPQVLITIVFDLALVSIVVDEECGSQLTLLTLASTIAAMIILALNLEIVSKRSQTEASVRRAVATADLTDIKQFIVYWNYWHQLACSWG